MVDLHDHHFLQCPCRAEVNGYSFLIKLFIAPSRSHHHLAPASTSRPIAMNTNRTICNNFANELDRFIVLTFYPPARAAITNSWCCTQSIKIAPRMFRLLGRCSSASFCSFRLFLFECDSALFDYFTSIAHLASMYTTSPPADRAVIAGGANICLGDVFSQILETLFAHL